MYDYYNNTKIFTILVFTVGPLWGSQLKKIKLILHPGSPRKKKENPMTNINVLYFMIFHILVIITLIMQHKFYSL